MNAVTGSHSVRHGIAGRVARDLPGGSYVNLGIGMPIDTLVLLRNRPDVVIHTENGMLGMRALDAGEVPDPDLVNAGKLSVGLNPGASFFHHADSFAMMRGGHLDFCVLGAYQVSAGGDLANWSLGRTDTAAAVGGAMDLVVGAKQVWVVMEHLTRDGSPRILEACTLPLTGAGVVDRIYTDLATIDVTQEGLVVTELIGDITFDGLQTVTPVSLTDGRHVAS